MHNADCSMQSLAFPIDEILQSDVNDKENKLIIEFFKNAEKENKEFSTIVCSNKKIEIKNKNGMPHELCLMINDFNKKNMLIENKNTVYNREWQNYVFTYLTNLRNYIHKMYNKKKINEEMHKNCNCSIFLSLKKKEHIIEIFQAKPICLHLYLFGINYKQIVFFIHVVTEYINTWTEDVESTNNMVNKELPFFLFVWIFYFLILLDSLQALDADVASNLQVIKRFCLKKIEETSKDYDYENFSIWNDLLYFHCKSNKETWKLLPSNCPISLFYVIYLMITKIFKQK